MKIFAILNAMIGRVGSFWSCRERELLEPRRTDDLKISREQQPEREKLALQFRTY